MVVVGKDIEVDYWGVKNFLWKLLKVWIDRGRGMVVVLEIF